MTGKNKQNTESRTTSGADKCPIDEKPLKNMFGDDPVIFREILNDFIVPTQKIIGEIKSGWEKQSAGEVEMAAHKLKSSAKSIGAFELGDICATLEKAALGKDWDTIDQFVVKLDPVMEEVVHYINSL